MNKKTLAINRLEESVKPHRLKPTGLEELTCRLLQPRIWVSHRISTFNWIKTQNRPSRWNFIRPPTQLSKQHNALKLIWLQQNSLSSWASSSSNDHNLISVSFGQRQAFCYFLSSHPGDLVWIPARWWGLMESQGMWRRWCLVVGYQLSALLSLRHFRDCPPSTPASLERSAFLPVPRCQP